MPKSFSGLLHWALGRRGPQPQGKHVGVAQPPRTDRDLLATLDLLRHACCYDLRDPKERQRSHNDLVWLFEKLVRVVKPHTFIEAGAFFAEASRKVKKDIPDTRVVAFEANPHNFKMCKERFDYEALGVEYLHYALSQVGGTVTFNIQVQKGDSDVRKTTGRNSLLTRDGSQYAYERVSVPAIALDSFFSEQPKESVLWIDVEGAAEMVLLGGKRLLKSTKLVFIEVEDKPIWPGQWLTHDVVRFLSGYNLVPVARDFESRSQIQYNMIFMKSSLLRRPGISRSFVQFYSRAAYPSSNGAHA
jgi:FkbM family methyltransferase